MEEKSCRFSWPFSLTLLKGVCTENCVFIPDICGVRTLNITFSVATDKMISPITSECCILSYAFGRILINIFIPASLEFSRD